MESGLDAQEALQADLSTEADRLAQTWGLGIQLVFRDGDPLPQLTAVAEEQRADSIVVGASTRLGSRAEAAPPCRSRPCR